MNVDIIERRALWVTVVANVVMAIAAWITFGLTNSQAILLDGNFSFVLAIATVVAVIVSKNKHKRTSIFPYGGYVYEAAFVLSKGFLILGIVVMAFFQNVLKVIAYFQGVRPEPVVLVPIYYYTVFILILAGVLLVYFNRQNKRINNRSGMLLAEAESVKLDGILTVATGIVFFLISFVAAESTFDFLRYIGDSLIVIVISIAIVGSPIRIIRNAFIELGGGTLQNIQEKKEIENVIQAVVNDSFSFETYTSKMGSGYLVIVYITSENDEGSLNEYRVVQKEIKQQLKDNFPVIFVEIALRD